MPTNPGRPTIVNDAEPRLRSPFAGLDLRSIAAGAARAAARMPTVATPAPVPDVNERIQPQPVAPAPEEAWAPPGQIASARATATAMRAAAVTIQGAGVGVRRDLGPEFHDAEDIRRDRDLARNGARQAPQRHMGEQPLPPALVRGHEQERPRNAVAVINQAVAHPLPVNPEWHEVRNLPGYTQGGVLRRIIRKTFEQVTDAQLEQMHMICDLLNPAAHVRTVANWINANAQRVDAADFDFAASVPGFKAQFQIFQDAKTTYVITQDVGGHYVYICPGGLAPAPALDHHVRAAEPRPNPGRPNTALPGPGV